MAGKTAIIDTGAMADFILRTRFSKIPADVVERAKMCIVDCCGVTLAGCEDPGSSILTDYVSLMGGRPEATLLGRKAGAPAALAALVNGTTGHVLDYDDAGWMMFVHPTVAVLPGVLALAEKDRLSGKALLEAYIVGVEAAGKVGLAIGMTHYEIGWHCTGTLGTLGAAAAAAKLLGLDAEQTKVCLGIAASLAGGVRQNFGTMVKSLHAGRAGENGVTAALLARGGYTASTSILESNLGFARVFAGGKDPGPGPEGLAFGKPFVFLNPGVGIKPYPSCGGTFPSIEAGLQLRNEPGFKASDIADIEMRVDTMTSNIVFYSVPQSGLEAKFSLEYCLARALLDGKVTLSQFTPEAIRDAQVLALIRKTRRTLIPGDGKTYKPTADITVKMKSGKVIRKSVAATKGYSEKEVTWEDVRQKFTDCASSVLTAGSTKKFLSAAAKLEAQADVSRLTALLAGRALKRR